jgi:hypothetical protein
LIAILRKGFGKRQFCASGYGLDSDPEGNDHKEMKNIRNFMFLTAGISIWNVMPVLRIRDVYPGCLSRIQGTKKHRIPEQDPQHWLELHHGAWT